MTAITFYQGLDESCEKNTFRKYTKVVLVVSSLIEESAVAKISHYDCRFG